MKIDTHQQINQTLCGQPQALEPGYSRVQLQTTDQMATDKYGLIHGGFIFGLADYAAMLAVNHPYVVLGASDVKFLKPSSVGDILTAEARVESVDGKKHVVKVVVKKEEHPVFEGIFTCFILKQHVLV